MFKVSKRAFQLEFSNFKNKFYPSNLNFFKIVCTIFRVIIFQDFAAPSPQNGAINLQTGQSAGLFWKMESTHSYMTKMFFLS